MLTSEARVETERPSRYLVQLCKHFDNKGRHLGHRPRAHNAGDAEALREMQAVAAQAQVEWSEIQGNVSLPWGRCALRADAGALTVHVEADDEASLGRLQELVAGHIERFGRREELKVTWIGLEASTASPGEVVSAAHEPQGDAARRRWSGRTTALAAVGVVAVAVHLGLGGILLANWQWTGWAVGAVLAIVLVKVVVLTGLGRFVIRRGKASRAR
ncbi:DUF2218 domain-containing protein [Streptomyces mirabilis]|uniref:DUF2218 domain-containing protein n=1 Tax=Streptomyces mirabilis TaxID=68239 RepID=UPI0036910CC1